MVQNILRVTGEFQKFRPHRDSNIPNQRTVSSLVQSLQNKNYTYSPRLCHNCNDGLKILREQQINMTLWQTTKVYISIRWLISPRRGIWVPVWTSTYLVILSSAKLSCHNQGINGECQRAHRI